MNNQQQPYPPQQPWGPPPPAPKKRSVGKFVGLGCAGIVGLFILIAIIAAVAGAGSDGSSKSAGTTTAKPAPTATKQPAVKSSGKAKPTHSSKKTHKPATKPKPKPKADVVTFKVWGTAPAGALGGLDITYGSDSDNRKGTFSNGTFTKTLPLNDDALYYDVTAQLQGSGDINCSITVDGHTKKGHAAGGFNICSAQLSSGLFGGWE